MMKGFTLFRCEKPDFEDIDFDELKAREPEYWRNVGVVPHYALYDDEKDQYVHKDCMQIVITERLLPSSAINRHLKLKAAEFVAETGQRVTRQQKAEWKEEFIDEHLPNAPLRETTVFVTWHDGYMFVGSSSQKTVDTILNWLIQHANISAKIVKPKGIDLWFAEQLKNPTTVTPFGKAKIVRIDTDEKVSYSNSGELDAAKELVENYSCRVAELGFIIIDNGDLFTLTDKGFVKGLKANTPDEDRDEADKITMYRANELLQRETRKRIAQLIESIDEGVEDDDDI